MKRPKHPDVDPLTLTDRQVMDQVDYGNLALCPNCGVMTWREDLEAHDLCQCGNGVYLYGNDYTQWGLTTQQIRNMQTSEQVQDFELEFELEEEKGRGNVPDLSRLDKLESRTKPEHDPERPFPNSLGRALYDLREELGVSQSQLAVALDCHRNTIYNLESGKRVKLYHKTRTKLRAAAIKASRKDLEKVFRD